MILCSNSILIENKQKYLLFICTVQWGGRRQVEFSLSEAQPCDPLLILGHYQEIYCCEIAKIEFLDFDRFTVFEYFQSSGWIQKL